MAVLIILIIIVIMIGIGFGLGYANAGEWAHPQRAFFTGFFLWPLILGGDLGEHAAKAQLAHEAEQRTKGIG